MLAKLSYRQKKQPEDSLQLRLLILAAMLVPLLAMGRTRSDLWPHVVIAAVGIVAGHWYSYRHRNNPSRVVRGVMFVAIHIALCWMFFGLATGGTVPQAQFAIYAQAITSFDLRYRSSLFNTLIHSLANLYVVATLSRTTELALYLLLFGALVLIAFFVAEKKRGEAFATITSQTTPPGPPRSFILFGFSFGGATMLAILIIFLFTPRYANRPIVPPFSINLPLRGGTSAEIINPGLPLVQINGWSDGSSTYYYGFDTTLDLRYRGGLSDEIVMYVRSPSRSYWRSHSYDFYDGTTWRLSDQTLIELENRGVYFELPVPLGSVQSQTLAGSIRAGGHQVLEEPDGPPRHIREMWYNDVSADELARRQSQQIVQTFNIVRDLPNLVFAAYRPAELFLQTERLSLDQGDGIRLPQSLRAGMTYSVVSYRPEFDPARLRQSTPASYPPNVVRYLQLPDNISTRVIQLSQELTAGHDNAFDKVQALNDHLLANYPYNFFPPPHPPGAEVVDQFLFVDREGVCEQYVTALVVMARSLGIPARLTAGYGSGQYNPVTGYYEVRYNDAHAWAEVYFPQVGWVPFDPTPGWTPQPYPTPAQNWLFANNGQLLRQFTGLNIPIGTITTGMLSGASLFAPFLVTGILLVGLLIMLFYLLRWLRHWWFTYRRQEYSHPEDSGGRTRRQILRTYQHGAKFFERGYGRRQSWETVTEYAQRVGAVAAFLRLSRLAEKAAYHPTPPTEHEVLMAREELYALKQLGRQKRMTKHPLNNLEN